MADLPGPDNPLERVTYYTDDNQQLRLTNPVTTGANSPSSQHSRIEFVVQAHADDLRKEIEKGIGPYGHDAVMGVERVDENEADRLKRQQEIEKLNSELRQNQYNEDNLNKERLRLQGIIHNPHSENAHLFAAASHLRAQTSTAHAKITDRNGKSYDIADMTNEQVVMNADAVIALAGQSDNDGARQSANAYRTTHKPDQQPTLVAIEEARERDDAQKKLNENNKKREHVQGLKHQLDEAQKPHHEARIVEVTPATPDAYKRTERFYPALVALVEKQALENLSDEQRKNVGAAAKKVAKNLKEQGDSRNVVDEYEARVRAHEKAKIGVPAAQAHDAYEASVQNHADAIMRHSEARKPLDNLIKAAKKAEPDATAAFKGTPPSNTSAFNAAKESDAEGRVRVDVLTAVAETANSNPEAARQYLAYVEKNPGKTAEQISKDMWEKRKEFKEGSKEYEAAIDAAILADKISHDRPTTSAISTTPRSPEDQARALKIIRKEMETLKGAVGALGQTKQGMDRTADEKKSAEAKWNETGRSYDTAAQAQKKLEAAAQEERLADGRLKNAARKGLEQELGIKKEQPVPGKPKKTKEQKIEENSKPIVAGAENPPTQPQQPPLHFVSVINHSGPKATVTVQSDTSQTR